MRPSVILNCAMSLDGYIGLEGEQAKLSNQEDLVRVHKLRASVDAVMVGVNTILVDNPRLDVRLIEGRSPVRVVVDSKARTPPESYVLDGSVETILAVSSKVPEEKVDELNSMENVTVLAAGADKVDLVDLMDQLHARGIRKLLLEGGGTLNKSMLEKGLVDKVRVTIASRILGMGVKLVNGRPDTEPELKLTGLEKIGGQALLTYEVVNKNEVA